MRRPSMLLLAAFLSLLICAAGCYGRHDDEQPVDDDASPNGDTITISSSVAHLTIWRQPFGWKLWSDDRGDVTETLNYGTAAAYWYTRTINSEYPQTLLSQTVTAKSAELHYLTTDDRKLKVVVQFTTDRAVKFTFSLEDQYDSWLSSGLSLHLVDGEAIYGLTERINANHDASELYPKAIGGLDRRGEYIPMIVIFSIAFYTPFYQSSQGYGLYVDSTFFGLFDVGMFQADRLRMNFNVAPKHDPTLQYYVFYGPDPDTILNEYTAVTGRPFIPPEWGFKHWRWRDECTPQPAELDGHEINADVADDLSHYDSLNFPHGNYQIDRPWTPGTEGFEEFAFDPVRFPNSTDMLNSFYSRGYHFLIWAGPWAIGTDAGQLGLEAQQGGYWAPNTTRYIDFTNPAALAWWEKHIAEFATATNLAGWKLDRGDEDNPSTWWDIYWDGRSGAEIRNIYPVIYQKSFFDAMRKVRGNDFVLVSRSGFAGSQQYTIANDGDVRGALGFGANQGIDLGLRSAIISQLHMAFMGFPIWGSNTGGYQEFRQRDVFARWLEFSAFSGTMDIGGTGNHAPWNMPTDPNYDPEMIDIYRTYTTMHHDLISYIYPYAQSSGQNGHAIVRPLYFDYMDDPAVKNMWDEYFYGPDILVAPVWKNGARDRIVYVPKGEFADYWNPTQTIAGPIWLHVDVPLDRIPIYIRKGATLLGKTW